MKTEQKFKFINEEHFWLKFPFRFYFCFFYIFFKSCFFKLKLKIKWKQEENIVVINYKRNSILHIIWTKHEYRNQQNQTNRQINNKELNFCPFFSFLFLSLFLFKSFIFILKPNINKELKIKQQKRKKEKKEMTLEDKEIELLASASGLDREKIIQIYLDFLVST